LRSEKHAASHAAARPIRERAEALRRDLTALVDRDSESYDAVVAALKLPKGTPEEKAARGQARARALQFATETPLRTAEASVAVLQAAADALAGGINDNAASDLGAGAQLAYAALGAAAMNVEINLPGLKDESFVSHTRGRLRTLKEDGLRLRDD